MSDQDLLRCDGKLVHVVSLEKHFVAKVLKNGKTVTDGLGQSTQCISTCCARGCVGQIAYTYFC